MSHIAVASEEKQESGSGPDFSCLASGNFAPLLSELKVAIMLTSYQASRVFIVRANANQLHVSTKTFPRPMGLAIDQNRLTLGIYSQLVDFRITTSVVEDLEPVGLVDGCYVPSSTHVTGMINVHDIAWGDEGLWVVNSQFSCLSLIQSGYSFVPKWKPPFISALAPEDRCHLNGMAMRDGKPRYVTCFTDRDDSSAWRKERLPIGQLIDVDTDKTLVSELFMPHSPRYYRGKVYYCNSGYGEFCMYDPVTGENSTLQKLPGFTRGLGFYGPLVFIGTSRSRSSDVKTVLPLKTEFEETQTGIWVLDLNSNEIISQLIFNDDLHQIYDIGVIAQCKFPEILQIDDPLVAQIFDYPGL
ncbi:TIGR03032 family protein [Gynuella sp.]|uniref:TIGR03032 family protein n=1 Tax=Gynuella sp. TaxID=2969146 RepID=UPI003D09C15C